MFENLNELTKATQKQKIALQAMMIVGFVDTVNYADNGDLLVEWCDFNYEYGVITVRITSKGESRDERSIYHKR